MPDSFTLASGLGQILGKNGSARPVQILRRDPVVYASSYPVEVVTCRRASRGRELQLYCKYMANIDNTSFGHRGGLCYEIQVYREVLANLPVSLPRFYGAFEDPGSNNIALVLRYMKRSIRFAKVARPMRALAAAVRWVANFHAMNENRLSEKALSFLTRYDSGYYLSWANRTSRFAGSIHERRPWLKNVCRRFRDCLHLLLSADLTVIHGEYYQHNILSERGVIYPVDWESAAIGPGEIDIATLVDGWGPEMTAFAAEQYQRARWPSGAPEDFGRRFQAAQLYVAFRWLGENPRWTQDEGNGCRFDFLHSTAEQLGLI